MNRRRCGAALRAATRVLAVTLVGAVVLTGCQQGDGQTPTRSAVVVSSSPAPVALGQGQDVMVASAFGPGRGDVPARVTVLAVRDHVAPAVPPRAPASHWTSAHVQVCRSKPVVLGFPAWVLGDDDGRTAQVSKVLHPEFPRPTFDNSSTATGCQDGWVTFVTSDDLVPTKVTFEQTRDVRGPWRIARP
jgi:hypothetical protein